VVTHHQSESYLSLEDCQLVGPIDMFTALDEMSAATRAACHIPSRTLHLGMISVVAKKVPGQRPEKELHRDVHNMNSISPVSFRPVCVVVACYEIIKL
jgi:hypothetical protein